MKRMIRKKSIIHTAAKADQLNGIKQMFLLKDETLDKVTEKIKNISASTLQDFISVFKETDSMIKKSLQSRYKYYFREVNKDFIQKSIDILIQLDPTNSDELYDQLLDYQDDLTEKISVEAQQLSNENNRIMLTELDTVINDNKQLLNTVFTDEDFAAMRRSDYASICIKALQTKTVPAIKLLQQREKGTYLQQALQEYRKAFISALRTGDFDITIKQNKQDISTKIDTTVRKNEQDILTEFNTFISNNKQLLNTIFTDEDFAIMRESTIVSNCTNLLRIETIPIIQALQQNKTGTDFQKLIQQYKDIFMAAVRDNSFRNNSDKRRFISNTIINTINKFNDEARININRQNAAKMISEGFKSLLTLAGITEQEFYDRILDLMVKEKLQRSSGPVDNFIKILPQIGEINTYLTNSAVIAVQQECKRLQEKMYSGSEFRELIESKKTSGKENRIIYSAKNLLIYAIRNFTFSNIAYAFVITIYKALHKAANTIISIDNDTVFTWLNIEARDFERAAIKAKISKPNQIKILNAVKKVYENRNNYDAIITKISDNSMYADLKKYKLKLAGYLTNSEYLKNLDLYRYSPISLINLFRKVTKEISQVIVNTNTQPVSTPISDELKYFWELTKYVPLYDYFCKKIYPIRDKLKNTDFGFDIDEFLEECKKYSSNPDLNPQTLSRSDSRQRYEVLFQRIKKFDSQFNAIVHGKQDASIDNLRARVLNALIKKYAWGQRTVSFINEHIQDNACVDPRTNCIYIWAITWYHHKSEIEALANKSADEAFDTIMSLLHKTNREVQVLKIPSYYDKQEEIASIFKSHVLPDYAKGFYCIYLDSKTLINRLDFENIQAEKEKNGQIFNGLNVVKWCTNVVLAMAREGVQFDRQKYKKYFSDDKDLIPEEERKRGYKPQDPNTIQEYKQEKEKKKSKEKSTDKPDIKIQLPPTAQPHKEWVKKLPNSQNRHMTNVERQIQPTIEQNYNYENWQNKSKRDNPLGDYTANIKKNLFKRIFG